MKDLEKIIKRQEEEVSLETRIIHTLVFLIIVYGCEVQTVKKAARK